ncbi:MAG: UDP-N-acetylmuramate dehydrogenase [Patescibacteria group bacterium]
MQSIFVDAFRARFPSALENESMSKHTNFRIGGPARLFFVANTADELVQAIQEAQTQNIPWYVMGGGSNLLVADTGFDGVIVQVAFREVAVEGETIHVDAGAITSAVARQSVEAGLAGFEWAVGVPGTIGGALYGNAGCYGGEMGNAVVSVDAVRVADGVRVTLSREDCQFGYRESLFKHERHVILSCVLKLARATDPAAGKAQIESIMQQRKEKQPLEQSSAGCIFKNYVFQDEKELEILKRHINEIPSGMLAKKSLGAGWLVDQVAMMGKSIGDAEISTKHGNFFLNKGKARAQDLLALISFAKMKVRDELGIELQEEVQLVGF